MVGRGQMPPPPKFFADYTTEAIASGTSPPPPPRIEGKYTVFGVEHDTERAIVTDLQDVPTFKLVYDKKKDPVGEMKRLNRSILFKFLELLDALAECPDQAPSKIRDIDLIIGNLHHVINTYRPFEGIASILATIEQQLSKNHALISDIDRVMNMTASDISEHWSKIAQLLVADTTPSPNSKQVPPDANNAMEVDLAGV